MIIRKETSPDGLLTLVIEKLENDDYLLGFEDYAWHTHGDLLIGEFGITDTTPELTVQSFLNQIIQDKIPFVVSYFNNEIKDIWITDDPASEYKYIQPGEKIVIRNWSGEVLK
jgi:hypothetical protein